MDRLEGNYTICRPPEDEEDRLEAPPGARVAAAASNTTFTTSPLAGKPVLSLRNIACRAGVEAPVRVRDAVTGGSGSLRDALERLDRRHRESFDEGEPTRTEDVTAQTGWPSEGPFTSWVVEGQSRTVESLAGPGPNGELLVFRWSSQDGWQAQDVSERTGRKIQGAVTSWQTGPGFERLGGLSPDGDVLVFSRRPGAGWAVENVTDATGQRLATPLTAWLTHNDIEHLAGVTADGDLRTFTLTQSGWRSASITASTGIAVAGPMTVWQTEENGTPVEHLAGRGPDGDVFEFRRQGGQRWDATNLSRVTGRRIVGPVTAWLTGSAGRTVEHLAGVGPGGELLVFWRSTDRWHAVDVTGITGRKVHVDARPAAYQLPEDGLTELLAVRGPADNLLLHWWTPALDWQALDLSDVTGRPFRSDPTVWLRSGEGRALARLAGAGTDNRLRVLRGLSRERLITDTMHRPWRSYRRKTRHRSKLLTILIDPHDPDVPAQSREHVRNLLFGASESMLDYFREVSGGLFSVENVEILGRRNPGSNAEPGWYDADHPVEEYAPGKRDIGSEAVRKAVADFDFKAYNKDGDGYLTPDELGLLIMKPGSGFGGGLLRRLGDDFTDRDQKRGIEVNGLKFHSRVAEVSIGDWQGIVSHELAHLFLHLDDMYISHQSPVTGLPYRTPVAAMVYSLMDKHHRGPHLDAFSKLKLGWVRPRVIFRAGRYTLPDVATRRVVWVLADPRRGLGEYFLVENRWGGDSYDRRLPDEGLAVWHVMESPCLYPWIEGPPNIPPSEWGREGLGGIRRAVRLIRPFQGYADDNRALWDGSDPETGYDLLPEDPDPQHAELRWGDGTPSGFALRSFSDSGPEMEATVEVPS